MKQSNSMKKLLSVLLMTMLIVSALPTALASQCPTPDGTYRDHRWGEWDTIKDPTCSQYGQKIRFCSVCLEQETARIAKKDHSYGRWTIVKEATCAEEGERTRKCQVCGHVQTGTIEKKEHSWGEWVVISEPTDSAAGLRERTCEKCGAVEQEALYPDGILKKGDRGDAVADLQAALNANGYDCGKVDGIFGEKTEKAVKELEAALGIDQDGIAWPIVSKTVGQAAGDDAVNDAVTGCTFEKWEASVPENGHGYYEEGETVTYGFFVTNTSDPNAKMPVMLGVQVYDNMLRPGSGEPVATFSGILPGANAYETVDYTVTAEDVARGYIKNTAMLVWNESDSGATVVGEEKSTYSNTLIVYTAPHDEANVYLEKIIRSEPENGGFYVEGEEIHYFLRLVNESSETITNVEITDSMRGGNEDAIVARAETVVPGGTLEGSFIHTVTPEDAQAGVVTNQAQAYWNRGERVSSNIVTANTGIISMDDPVMRYFELNDVAFVGEEYNNYFMLQNLSGDPHHVFHEPVEVGSDIGALGLEYGEDAGDSGVWIWMRGTPTQTGSRSCLYTMEVDDELWIIEIVITVVDKTEGVSLVKRCTSTPADREGYVENETVSYAVEIINNSDAELYNAELIDPLSWENDFVINVPAHGSHTVEYSYIVTSEDVERGYIDNVAELKYQIKDGVYETVKSNTVRVNTKAVAPIPAYSLQLELTLFEGNGSMVPGTEIDGTLLCTNTSDDLIDLTIGTIQNINGKAETGDYFRYYTSMAKDIGPGDIFYVSFVVTVTEDDIAAGEIIRDFTMYAYPAGTEDYNMLVTSNTVRGTIRIGEPQNSLHIDLTSFEGKSLMVVGTELKGTLLCTNTGAGALDIVSGRIPTPKGTIEPTDWFDSFPPESQNLMHGDSCTISFNVTITEDDFAAGKVIRDFTMMAYAAGTNDYDTRVNSNTVHGEVEIGDPPTEGEREPYVMKKEVSMPGDGRDFYIENETVKYEITFVNCTDQTLHNVNIYDNVVYADDMTYNELAYLIELAAGESRTCYHTYTVTAEDVEAGQIVDFGYVEFMYEHDDIRQIATSEEVITLTGRVRNQLYVHKEEISAPANGSYYTEGEIIKYRITYKNVGNVMLGETMIYDTLKTGGEIAYAEHLNPGEQRECYFEYTVNKDDVELWGVVYNMAIGEYELDGNYYHYDSNTVISPTGNDPGKIIPPVISTPVLKGDCCVRSIEAHSGSESEYMLHYCADHYDTLTAVQAMVSVASTPEMQLLAWQYAHVLWQNDADEMYKALMDAANGSAKAIVLNEFIMFKTQIASHEATLTAIYPDAPELVAKKIAELYMNRCIDLCYELHTAPEDRADDFTKVKPGTAAGANGTVCAQEIVSVKGADTTYKERYCGIHTLISTMSDPFLYTSGNSEPSWRRIRLLWLSELENEYKALTSALTDSSELLGADMRAFKAWLSAREALVDLLYPDRNEITAQMMAQTAMNRAIELCEDVK